MKRKIKKVAGVIIAGVLAIAHITGCAPESVPAGSQSQVANVEVRVDSGYIQWRSSANAEWENLISLSELKGETGAPGPTGAAGPAGATGRQGETGDRGARGPAGFQGPAGVAGPTGAAGAQGPQGSDGTDGREVEVQSNGTYIQWRYAGDSAWNDLVALSTLIGPQGEGLTGETGAQGLTGAIGATGAPGPTGPQGPQGEPGPTGATGPQGSPGPMGATGPQGPTGADGTALAYAQYEVTGGGGLYDTHEYYITLSDMTASTDTSIISRSGSDITLVSGHAYLISYSVMVYKDSATPFSYYFDAHFNDVSVDVHGGGSTARFSENPGFGNIVNCSGSFLVTGGGTLFFTCFVLSDDLPRLQPYSKVTIVCIQ